MPIDVNTLEDFMNPPESLATRTEYSDVVSVLTKSTRFLPYTSVERNRKILNDNEDFSCHEWFYCTLAKDKDFAMRH